MLLEYALLFFLAEYKELNRISIFAKNSLSDSLGGEGGTAGLGGRLLHGRPIFDGGLNPDGFGSAILHTPTPCYVTLQHGSNWLVKLKGKFKKWVGNIGRRSAL